jgi:crossover junction endodeoxyribonuclease RusA
MKFTVPGEPVPKGRPRFNRKTGTMYTPPATRAYENSVALLVMVQREKFGTTRVKMEIEVYSKKERIDLDNILKSIMDGAQNGRAFEDDSQVKRICIEGHLVSENPRVEVTIEEMPT